MKTRRSKMNKKKERVVTIMYSNIQGITKKKESLLNIMEEINCDICLLAETMTCRIKIPGLTLLTLGFFVQLSPGGGLIGPPCTICPKMPAYGSNFAHILFNMSSFKKNYYRRDDVIFMMTSALFGRVTIEISGEIGEIRYIFVF